MVLKFPVCSECKQHLCRFMPVGETGLGFTEDVKKAGNAHRGRGLLTMI